MVVANAAVTGSSPEAVVAGTALLRVGGNAVDAAVAAALTSCVADPCNTGHRRIWRTYDRRPGWGCSGQHRFGPPSPP